MTQKVDLHALAQMVGWTAVYVDDGYTSYEYIQKVKNIESLCHVLKLYDDLDFTNYYSTFETIISVLPKKLIKKIKKLTKKCDEQNIVNVLDLACFEIETFRNNSTYNKLYTYGNMVGVDITKHGYYFVYTMSKPAERKILSLIESSLPVDLAPTLGKLKKLDYKIGYIKQNGIKK